MTNKKLTQLAKIDLFTTKCPRGMKVEVEGFKPFRTDRLLPIPYMAHAIIQVYVSCTGQSVTHPIEFIGERVTVTKLNKAKKYIRVKVKPL